MIQQYTAIYETYRSDMVNFCRSRLDDPEQADDGVQQVFLALYEAMSRGVEIREPRAWLYKTARFIIIRLNEKRQKEQEHVSQTEYEDAVRTASVSFDSCLLDAMDTDREERLVQHVLSNLTEEEQGMIEAVYVRGMKHDELGEQLGMKRNTVSQRLKRLRLKVEKIVTEILQEQGL